MQVVSRGVIVPTTSSSESSKAPALPSALKMLLDRVANSTRLSLAQKRSFADAIKNAFETGNGKLMVKVMTMVAQAEAQATQGRYRANSIDEILGSSQTDSGAQTLDTTQLLSGQDRIRQLLFS